MNALGHRGAVLATEAVPVATIESLEVFTLTRIRLFPDLSTYARHTVILEHFNIKEYTRLRNRRGTVWPEPI